MLNIKTKENQENINYIITHNLNKNSGYWRGGTLFNLEKAMPELGSIDMALIYKKQLEKRIQYNVEPIKEKYADRGNNGRLPDGWHNLQERKKAWGDLNCELKKKLKEVDNTIAKYYSENRRPSTGHSHNNQRGMSRNYSYRSGMSASYSRASVRQNNNRAGEIVENRQFLTQDNFYPQRQSNKYGNSLASTTSKLGKTIVTQYILEQKIIEEKNRQQI
jgi:hypothetical protein